MHEHDSDAQGDRESTSENRSGLSRRALLQTALVGTAAIPLLSDAVAQRGTPSATPASAPDVIAGTSAETWSEPWVWRPSDWPGQQLELNVVENENPGAIVGFGNQTEVLFSYNGATPGPTIRMRGDETLLVRLRNLVGQNFGTTYVGPYPDPPTVPDWVSTEEVQEG